jgi:DNA mismatch repair protein MutS
MPAAVLNQARQTLEALEAQASTQQAQIDLFALPAVAEVATSSSAVEDALEAINPDDLSPREALEALYQLKKMSHAGNKLAG